MAGYRVAAALRRKKRRKKPGTKYERRKKRKKLRRLRNLYARKTHVRAPFIKVPRYKGYNPLNGKMRGTPRRNEKRDNEIRELYKDHSIIELAEKYGVSKQRIWQIVSESPPREFPLWKRLGKVKPAQE